MIYDLRREDHIAWRRQRLIDLDYPVFWQIDYVITLEEKVVHDLS
jgi:hypothetical protein